MVTINIRDGIAAYLLSKYHIAVNPAWLDHTMTDSNLSGRPNSTSLPELSQIVLHKLLLTDIRMSIKVPTQQESELLLPKDIDNMNVKERSVKGPIVVQLLDIEHIGRSRLAQIETIEMHGKGETTGGNQIIRSITRDESGEISKPITTTTITKRTPLPPSSACNYQSAGSSPHRVIFQDAAGTLLYALELRPIPFLDIEHPDLYIGTKFILSNLVVARGMALLELNQISPLGGKLENRDKAWRVERKERLLAKLGAE
ncbi:hypothetical protein KEM54_005116 [Ascosphaera aggregata]|nr:hypothetical protein KEM54_005116 [Ascosphaera aggregata]